MPSGFQPLFPQDGPPAGWIVRHWADVGNPANGEPKWESKDGVLTGAGDRGCWLISGKEATQAHQPISNQTEQKSQGTETSLASPPADIENRVSKSDPQRVLLFFGDGTFEAYNSRK